MKIKLALDWTPNINHIGFFIAKELGYFNEFDLNINRRMRISCAIPLFKHYLKILVFLKLKMQGIG